MDTRRETRTGLVDVAVTNHPFSQMVCSAFARGCGGRLVEPDHAGATVACYGILRGCGEAMRRADCFYYIDHGFFHRSDPGRGDGYYRVCRDRLWPPSTTDESWSRFESLNIELKPWRETGSHIIVAPPSPAMSQFLGLDGWLDRVLLALAAVTDRPVIVSTKKNPAGELFRNAWCLVTEHSQVAIDALVEGIPAIMLSEQRRLGSLAEIEDPPMDRTFFSRLANSQWTLDEMASGACWAALP